SLGTSGVVFAPTPRYTPDPRGRLHAFCYTDADSWHVMGVILAAAACQRWFRQLLGDDAQAPSFDALDDAIAASPPGAEGLLWLPYLSGERTPHNDPNARAVLAGASLAHGRAHVLRAIAEGVAFALADCFDLLADPCGVEVDELLVSGGGARGDNQCQIIADVLGREIARPAVDEGPAYGAALLAGEAAALWTREAMAEQLVIERRFEPRGELRALYDEARGRFGELYRVLYG
ncbi:MAG: xylulokinase, partial [Myxococcales bacterium]|nr:xylulokinase [Myxococcales bacterium]